MKKEINSAVATCHGLAVDAGWWDGVNVNNPLFIPAKLCLVHSELTEAMEGARKDLMDDHLPNRPMLEVELADAIIRIMDLAGGLGLDLGGAMVEKLEYNKSRADHKAENRNAKHGKRF
jgi:NTP pyrophosphatase (non-canonical NTP hydrolase)